MVTRWSLQPRARHLAPNTWNLTPDTSHLTHLTPDTCRDSLSAVEPKIHMSYQTFHHNRNYGCRITEFVYQGYRCITLENEKLRVSIAADKGSDIYEFLYKPRDVDFMWRSWTGMRAQYVPTSYRAAGAFMDYYEGGWQELFPNCGNLSVHQGVELGQHGEVALLPWRYTITRDDPDEIEMRFEVRTVRTPFHLIKTVGLRRNEGVLRIHER